MFVGAHQISSLELICRCKWIGKFGELETHLQSCKYALLPCTNNCDSKVLRKNLKRHLTKRCPRRQYQCPHCGEMGEHHERITTHLKTCLKVKVPVPNTQYRVKRPVSTSHSTFNYLRYKRTPFVLSHLGEERIPRKDQLKEYEKGDRIYGHHLLSLTTHTEQALSTRLLSSDEQIDDIEVNTQTIADFDWQTPIFEAAQDLSGTDDEQIDDLIANSGAIFGIDRQIPTFKEAQDLSETYSEQTDDLTVNAEAIVEKDRQIPAFKETQYQSEAHPCLQ